MHRVLRYAIGWLAAASAAVLVAFLVVESAVGPRGDTAPDVTSPGRVDARSSDRPVAPRSMASPSVPPATRSAAVTPRASASPARRTPAAAASTPAGRTGAAVGELRSVEPPGGSVVLRVFSDRAELVSATPAPGFGVQHWETADWLRVTFTSVDASHSSSVFVTWQDHPPRIETVRHDA